MRSRNPTRDTSADRPASSPAPELVTTTSAAAVLSFLKQSALEPTWSISYFARALGVDAQTAKRTAAELAAVGYIEPIPGKADNWRNTEAGDTVAGAKEPRLTRATADKAVADFLDRVNHVNADGSSPLRVAKAIAVGGYTTEHQHIQDVEVAVALEPKRRSEVTRGQEREMLRFLKGRSRALEVVQLTGWILTAPGRALFDADRNYPRK